MSRLHDRQLRRRTGQVCSISTFLGSPDIAASGPGVQLCTRRVHRPHFVVDVSVNRHPLALLPSLDGRNIAAEIGRDFLPGIQPVFGCIHERWSARGRFVHHPLPFFGVIAGSETKLYVLNRVQQRTAFDGKVMEMLDSSSCRLRSPQMSSILSQRLHPEATTRTGDSYAEKINLVVVQCSDAGYDPSLRG